MSAFKKGDTVIYQKAEAIIIFCSLNRVKIKLSDGSEKMVSYYQLKPKK